MKSVKLPSSIELLAEGGRKLAVIRHQLLQNIKVGVIPLDIDNLAKKLIREAGGTPSFMTVGNYRWATCISVNEGVVHGVPDQRPFQEGDVVSLDVGLFYKGWHTDTSWTKIVHSSKFKIEKEKERFLKIGKEALERAIKAARPENRVGNISYAIQKTIEGAGYNVVKSLVGHGVGRVLHEEPQIPGFLVGDIKDTPKLEPGMVLAVEVIYAQGKGEIAYGNKDGWTLVTKDGSLAGLFEETVWVSEQGPVVLTRLSPSLFKVD